MASIASVGRTLALIAALVLGLGSALLVAACGDEAAKPSISSGDADELLSALQSVEDNFDQKNCTVAALDAQTLVDEVQALPGSVDPEVLKALEGAAKNLRDLLDNPENCEQPKTTTTETETTEEETETTETTETTEEPTETEVPTFPTTPTEPEPPPSGGTGL